jgi:hypothetical protein
VRQQPPELRCCTLTGRMALSGKGGTLLCRPPLRTGLAGFLAPRLKQVPEGSQVLRWCCPAVGGGAASGSARG